MKNPVMTRNSNLASSVYNLADNKASRIETEKIPQSTTHSTHNLNSSINAFDSSLSKNSKSVMQSKLNSNDTRIVQNLKDEDSISTTHANHNLDSSLYGQIQSQHVSSNSTQNRNLLESSKTKSEIYPISTTHAIHNSQSSIHGLYSIPMSNLSTHKDSLQPYTEHQDRYPISTTHATHDSDSSLLGVLREKSLSRSMQHPSFSPPSNQSKSSYSETKDSLPQSTTHATHNLRSSIYAYMNKPPI